MDPHGSLIDFDWVGVGLINNYAMFLGYMLMGVRGLGLLVLMWSTIIFLGSFISLMQKDFWSLVVIMLIQTAGALDLLLKEKLGEVVNSVQELLVALVTTAVRPMRTLGDVSIRRSILAMVLLFGLWLVQLLVFYIISRPLAFLCMYGMYISAGISLWRLVEHDFGNADAGANLNSALQILYSLGVAQGLLYGYRAIYAAGARINLAEDVASFFSLDLDIVSNYLFETIKGCSKDPSFAKGRNLATYAVDMMLDYKSSDMYLSGVKILSTLIQKETPIGSKLGRLVQIKELLTGSTYFNHIVQNLLWTLGPRSPYSMEIREQAAIIVSHVACDIRLEQFPGGIQCISRLLDTPEEHRWRPEGYQRNRLPNMYGRDWLLEKYERDWLLEKNKLNWKRFFPPSEVTAGSVSIMTQNGDSNNNQLQLQGLRILRKLTVNDGNCRVMSNTEGLVSKEMEPLVSYKQHQDNHVFVSNTQDNHVEWSVMAEEAFELMSRLMAAPGKTGKKLRREITSSGKATSTLERIIGCEDCKAKVQRLAVETVLDLSVDTSSIIASETSSTIFITTLLELFLSKNIRGDRPQRVGSRRTLLDLMQTNWAERCSSSSIHWMKKQSHIRNLAGEKLALLLKHSEENATIILQTGRDVVGDLVKTIVDAKINNIHKTIAVSILEHLCSSYTMDDEHLFGLKVAMANIMPKLLRELLRGYESTEADDQEIECASQDSGQADQQSCEQHESNELKEALISLCETIFDRWVNTDPELACRLNGIAADEMCVKQGSFSSLIKEARNLLDRNKAKKSVTEPGSSSTESWLVELN